MAALLADEDFHYGIVLLLRAQGHDVETVQGQKRQRTKDENVLRIAIAQNRTVLTYNRWDFIPLHNDNPNHAGILVCTRDDDFSALAERIHAAIQQEGDLSGKLIRVNRPAN